MEGIRRALVLGPVLIVGTGIEQVPFNIIIMCVTMLDMYIQIILLSLWVRSDMKSSNHHST